MNFYSDETYGESVAGVYDEWYSEYDSHAMPGSERINITQGTSLTFR